MSVDPDTLDDGAPDYEVGEWYQFAAPGGFLMMGRYCRPLGYGMHRFVDVRHMRNAGDIELPQMTLTGTGQNTVFTKHAWKFWDGVPIWKAKCTRNPFSKK